MPIVNGVNSNTVKEFTLNPVQTAATRDLCIAVGDVLIKTIGIVVSVGVTGLTSLSVQSNLAVPDVVLASTLLAALGSVTNLTPRTIAFVLPSGSKIQYTIVGTGSAGSLQLMFETMGGMLV